VESVDVVERVLVHRMAAVALVVLFAIAAVEAANSGAAAWFRLANGAIALLTAAALVWRYGRHKRQQ
jgi:hypothetical protein